MNARALATVAFATVGIVALLHALVGLVLLAALWIPLGDWGGTASWFPIYTLASSLVYLGTGLWLVLRGHQLAQRLFPEHAPLTSSTDVRQVLMAALLVVGVCLVTFGLSDVVSRVAWWKQTMDVHYDVYPLGDLLSGLMWIGIGLLLVLRPRRIVGAWYDHVLGERSAGGS